MKLKLKPKMLSKIVNLFMDKKPIQPSDTLQKNDKDIENLKKEYSQYDYQWMKGDSVGEVRLYSDIVSTGDSVFLCFTDGSRIKMDLLDEYMLRIDRDSVEVPLNTPNGHKNIKVSSTPAKSVPKETPIRMILGAQKPNWVEVEFKVKVNLPSKGFYDILCASFENVEGEIVNFAVDDLDLEMIKESLRQNIIDIYKK